MKPLNDRKESWTSIYSVPPSIEYPYTPIDALTDIPGISHALDLFLASHMLESEEYCNKSDEKKLVFHSFFSILLLNLKICRERLYFAAGYGLIQCVKGLMSYEDEVACPCIPANPQNSLNLLQDLLAGITHTKHSNVIANQHRKKQAFLGSRLAGYVVSTLQSGGVGFIKSMTQVERHAELVYAESMFEKALLGIVYSGDWLAFIKEAYVFMLTLLLNTNPSFSVSTCAPLSPYIVN